MVCVNEIHQAPPNSGYVSLGRSLPSLLDEACDSYPNSNAFNQWTDAGWQSMSNQAFQAAAEAFALGLVSLGIEKGDRIAFLMHSDIHFCIADFGCLIANAIDVPIDLTQTIEHIIFVLQHSDTKVLIISNLDLLAQIVPYLQSASILQQIIVANVPANWQQTRLQWGQLQAGQLNSQGGQLDLIPIPESACLDVPTLLHPSHADPSHAAVPRCIQLFSLDEIKQRGALQRSREQLQCLRAARSPQDVVTIIYIPDAHGHLQGVMLTHENLSGNAIAAFSGIKDLQRGAAESILSFLPLNHVLARTLLYGHINYGHSVYFSNPNRVSKHLKEIQPTVLITVPLLLEKIYSKILEQTSKPLASTRFPWLQFLQTVLVRFVANWALGIAKQYELGHTPRGRYALALKLADWLVLCRWRSLFGDRLKYLICGGAPLKAELANVFSAAGVPILQGYGLTQASAVVCCNRGSLNRAGTVGVPIAGVEVAIADDQEVLVRSPYITPGYYKNPDATKELIDEQGWLHTGDLGTFTAEGFLKITGLKKSLFKLSTGKYIAPQPIEQRLKASPLVSQAVAVGAEHKFCAMLIVPNMEALHQQAEAIGIDTKDEELLSHPTTLVLYQSLVDAANCHLPYWAMVKRFRLIKAEFTVENGLLTAMQEVNRAHVLKTFANEIEALYTEVEKGKRNTSSAVPSDGMIPATTVVCPAFAQSLNPRLTT